MRSLLLASFVLFAACSSGSDIPVSVTGRYHVDADQFANMIADRMIEAGHVPRTMRDTLLEKLAGSKFDLLLEADGSFTATQQVLTDSRRYTGTWSRTGASFELDQTHENGQPLEDRMRGTLKDGKLDLAHEGEAGTMRVILYHERAARPGR